jgi:sigma-B regulation protein RsbU (phosphoserine phosphatase)
MNELVAQSTSSEKYVTLFYGELDELEKRFYYANAGHNYPILVRSNGNVELLEIGGPIIGAFPFMEYQSADIELNPDDVLFFFTDGLSEAMDSDGKEYSEERIKNFVVENRNLEPVDLMKAIIEDVQKFDPTYPPQDDTTIIALKMLNHGTEIHTV